MTTPPAMQPLTRHQLAVLVIASRMHAWTHTEAVVRLYEALGLGPLRFRQELSAIVRLPAAEAFDPITVRRLRRPTSRTRTEAAAR